MAVIISMAGAEFRCAVGRIVRIDGDTVLLDSSVHLMMQVSVVEVVRVAVMAHGAVAAAAAMLVVVAVMRLAVLVGPRAQRLFEAHLALLFDGKRRNAACNSRASRAHCP
jgi:hypothetical protein